MDRAARVNPAQRARDSITAALESDDAGAGHAAALLTRARATIARATLAERATPERLGTIMLLPHQRALAGRLAAHIARWRGALVAEPPGWGKTFAALAVVPADATLTVVAPATLRARWGDALARSGRAATFVGVESLSRRRAQRHSEWVLVDECHHLRNPATLRYDAAAELCAHARVVLLSGTPVQNRVADLAAQLALFLGEGAHEMSLDELARHVLRSGIESATGLPHVGAPARLRLPSEEAWLERIARLPPPVPPRDGGVAGALLQYTLVRQWASSRAALVGGLRRRLAAAIALRESLEAGRAPSRRELTAWQVDDDVLQPAFPELVAAGAEPGGPRSSRALAAAVRRHERALASLLAALRDTPDPDAARADVLRALLAAHPDARIVAFSTFAETVRTIAHHLRRCPGVAWVTASGARVASGQMARDALLAQFGAVPPNTPAAERVRLLVTTDVLSEGLDLQGASVLVHLDLPWNPARLEQRVGRLRRIGARSARVTVYALAPPADAERLLRIERRLRDKLASAAALGRAAHDVLPLVEDDGPSGHVRLGAADIAAEIAHRLAHWAADDALEVADVVGAVPVAGVRAARAGWLASLREGPGQLLVADLGDGPTADGAAILHAIELAGGEAAAPDPALAADARAALERWIEHRTAERLAGGAAHFPVGPARRAAARRLAAIVARLGRARRPALSREIALARRALTTPAGVGADRRLAALLEGEPDDEKWLVGLAAVLRVDGAVGAAPDDDAGVAATEALILLAPVPR